MSGCFLRKFGKLLGKGKHGSVYAVGQDMVVKVVKQSEIATKEAELATLIGKKRIGPKVRQITYCEKNIYIYMQRVSGTLKDWLSSKQRTQEELFDRLHALGYFHGDVHWENVAYVNTPEGRTRWTLLDFGWVHNGRDTRRTRPDLPLAKDWWGAGMRDKYLQQELNTIFS